MVVYAMECNNFVCLVFVYFGIWNSIFETNFELRDELYFIVTWEQPLGEAVRKSITSHTLIWTFAAWVRSKDRATNLNVKVCIISINQIFVWFILMLNFITYEVLKVKWLSIFIISFFFCGDRGEGRWVCFTSLISEMFNVNIVNNFIIFTHHVYKIKY